ncbi:MAG: phosphoribosyltransferase [Cyclobacteriaceae bacterium]
MFEDRADAASQLAQRLEKYRHSNAVVLGIPKGGVPIAYHLAEVLQLDMEIALTKKLSHPYNPVQAIGAISLDSASIHGQHDVPEAYITAEIERIRIELKRRRETYTGSRERISLSGRPVIITDDGITTGSTMLATIDLVRKACPSKIIIAVPVSPPWPRIKLQKEADEMICLLNPADFFSVSQFYRSYEQVSEEEVISLLHH